MTKEDVMNEVTRLRGAYGTTCTDPEFITDSYVRFIVQNEEGGYIQEYDLECDLHRSKGLGPMGFWTEWLSIWDTF